MAASYFQGGDFVELLSAQGKAPAAAWRLQGQVSKSFDKRIKGNAFVLAGGSETKMQLPKTAAASASLGLAQRFLVLQLLVPFTRSFSLEIGFSDFHKVRRRFVLASAFRDTARTALHVQLPLNDDAVPRDEWLNLVLDLQALAETHFPDDGGFRSMESLCIAGSCRLKRVFTMKHAPSSAQGSQTAAHHATVRALPRQFVFSATRRGADLDGRTASSSPVPTIYFALPTASATTEDVALNGALTVTGSSRSGIRPPTRTVRKPRSAAKARPRGAARPATEAQGTKLLSSRVDTGGRGDAGALARQRLRTRTPTSAANGPGGPPSSRSAMAESTRRAQTQPTRGAPVSPVCPASSVTSVRHHHVLEPHPRVSSPANVSSECEPDKATEKSSLQENKAKQDEIQDVQRPLRLIPSDQSHLDSEQEATEAGMPVHSPSSLANPVSSSCGMQPKFQTSDEGDAKAQTSARREEIVGEIQRKLAMLEHDDEHASERDRELFLRHTSLNSGEWHLKPLSDGSEELQDPTLLSDDDCEPRVSRDWRQELEDMGDAALSPSPTGKRRPSASTAHSPSIFSFSRSLTPGAASTRGSEALCDHKNVSNLFDFDSLLQESDEPVRPTSTARTLENVVQTGGPANKSSPVEHPVEQSPRGERGQEDSDEEDLELRVMLAAKRSSRRVKPQPWNGTSASGAEVKSEASEVEDVGGSSREDVVDDLPSSRDQLSQQPAKVSVAQEVRGGDDADADLNAWETTVVQEAPSCQSVEEEEQFAEIEDADDEADENEDDELSMDMTSDLDALSVDDEEDPNDLEEHHEESASGTWTKLSSPTQALREPEAKDASEAVDSSFDFEDLVEELSEDDQDGSSEDPRVKAAASLEVKALRDLPPVPRRKKPSSLKPRSPSTTWVPRSNQQDHELGRSGDASPGLTKVLTPAVSPPIRPPRGIKGRNSSNRSLSREGSGQTGPRSAHLSASFSSHRLQKLLESTDWTAELTSHARVISSPSRASLARSRDILRKRNRSRESLPPREEHASGHGSPTRRSSLRSSPPSSSTSIELLYDPLLRCYFDPVANKYYALAE